MPDNDWRLGPVLATGIVHDPPSPGEPGYVRFHEDPQAPGRGDFTCEYLIEGWAVGGAYWLSPQGLIMTALWIAPQDPAAGLAVTPTLLRSISVLQLLDAIRQRYTWGGASPMASLPELEVRRQPGRRRTRRDDPRKQAQLRRVAMAYFAEQGNRGVHKRLAARFRVTPDEIKALIRAARADGWLAAGAVSGTRKAEPGPRLLADEEFMAARERRAAQSPAERKDE
jgi:hypothetical protein